MTNRTTKSLLGASLGCLMVGTVFFQARGAMELFSAALPRALPSEGPSPSPRPKTQVVANTRLGEPILTRNPFDSVTGPLTATEVALPTARSTEGEVAEGPMSAPICDGIRVTIISESSDPSWSLAAIQGPAETKPVVRKLGEVVGTKTIAFIGHNPVLRSPSVWFSEAEALCQAPLFGEKVPPTTKTAPATSSSAAGVVREPARKGASKAPPEILAKIQKVSDTEYNIDRSVIDQLIERQSELIRARIVPDQQNGQVVGLRLYGVRPDTVLGALGIQNGDRLETINGFSMASPEKALEVYARLRSAEGLKIQLNRAGKNLLIDYKIK